MTQRSNAIAPIGSCLIAVFLALQLISCGNGSSRNRVEVAIQRYSVDEYFQPLGLSSSDFGVPMNSGEPLIAGDISGDTWAVPVPGKYKLAIVNLRTRSMELFALPPNIPHLNVGALSPSMYMISGREPMCPPPAWTWIGNRTDTNIDWQKVPYPGAGRFDFSPDSIQGTIITGPLTEPLVDGKVPPGYDDHLVWYDLSSARIIHKYEMASSLLEAGYDQAMTGLATDPPCAIILRRWSPDQPYRMDLLVLGEERAELLLADVWPKSWISSDHQQVIILRPIPGSDGSAMPGHFESVLLDLSSRSTRPLHRYPADIQSVIRVTAGPFVYLLHGDSYCGYEELLPAVGFGPPVQLYAERTGPFSRLHAMRQAVPRMCDPAFNESGTRGVTFVGGPEDLQVVCWEVLVRGSFQGSASANK